MFIITHHQNNFFSDTDVEILNHSFSQVSLSSDDGVPENNPNGNQSSNSSQLIIINIINIPTFCKNK